MTKKELTKGIASLQEFIKLMVRDKVTNTKEYLAWVKEHEKEMEKLFFYERREKMPAITSLVKAFFHEDLPLIGLNYTPIAHNTLFAFQDGWTTPLRLCRGIIFDFEGDLVAKGFEKFFNYGENKETLSLPDTAFEATVKHDGHLGIIFEYKGRFLITTRGSFISRTSKLATKMLAKYAKKGNWKIRYPDDITTLVEIIHPETEVLTNYGEKEEFVIIGAFNREELHDYGYKTLLELGKRLDLPVTKLWTGKSLNDLVKLMKDRSVKNQEGYVVRFVGDGLRVKLKFETYIAEMIKAKLNYTYLMNRFISGNLNTMVELLDEEIIKTAKEMLGEIMLKVSKRGSSADKWRELYKLVPEEEATPYFQGICRKFVKALHQEKV